MPEPRAFESWFRYNRIMPLPCSVCSHPDRESIDKQVAHGVMTRRNIALGAGVSLSALQRHIVHALRAAGMLRAAATERGETRPEGRPSHQGRNLAQEVHQGLDRLMAGAGLAQEVGKLRQRAERLCAQAETTGDARTALLAIRELTRLLELQGRMVLEASAGRASDVSSHPVWAQLSGLIMHQIAPCPRCKPLVTAAIRERLGVSPQDPTPGVAP